MQEARFYKVNKNSQVKCLLCPHLCEINEGSKGLCNTRINISGKLYCSTYGKLTAISLDPIEKKPFYHFHPHKMVLSLGSFGCNFKCDFCQNFRISHDWETLNENFIKSKTEAVISEALKHENNFGIAYTYNEPFTWYEFMYDVAVLAKLKGLKNVVVSNGYVNKKSLESIIEFIDAFNIDLKFFDEDIHKRQTGGELKFVLQTLKTIVSNKKHLEITNLIIPGLNDNKEKFGKMVNWIADQLGEEIPLHINRYYPAYKSQFAPTSANTLYELKSIACSRLKNVYCGNI